MPLFGCVLVFLGGAAFGLWLVLPTADRHRRRADAAERALADTRASFERLCARFENVREV